MRVHFKQFFSAFSLLSCLVFFPALAAAVEPLNVYSSRKEHLIRPLLDQFTEKTGIPIKLLTGKDDALIQRLEAESDKTPADVLMTVDAGRLHRAKSAGLLQPVESKILNTHIPAHLRDSDNQWFGLTTRARVIMYNLDKVKPEELSSYENLTDPKWKGRICIRSSSNIYNQSLLASMIAEKGVEEAESWARGIVANMARSPQGNDRAQMKAAAIGECDIAIANTYYYALWLTSSDPQDRANAKKLGIFFPNQQTQGTHINVSGAGVTRYSQQADKAIQLIEFLSEDSSQQWYAEANNEYPVKPNVPTSELVKSWGFPFKADTLNLSKLGEYNASAVKTFDRAGWK